MQQQQQQQQHATIAESTPIPRLIGLHPLFDLSPHRQECWELHSGRPPFSFAILISSHASSIAAEGIMSHFQLLEAMHQQESFLRDEPDEGQLRRGLNRTASAFGTYYENRAFRLDLPQHDIPTSSLPKEVAFRLIEDDLTLDGQPR
jgi:hypothetical protein